MKAAALGLVLLHAAASWADAPEPQAHHGRYTLTLGGAARVSNQTVGTQTVHIEGFAPTVVHLSGTQFFLRWLGLSVDGAFETFSARRTLVSGTEQKVQVYGARLFAEAAGRWSPLPWLGLELHLGWAAGGFPALRVFNAGAVVSGGMVTYQGPSLGAAVAVMPRTWVGAELVVRLVPFTAGSAYLGAPLDRFTAVSGALKVSLGRLVLGPWVGGFLVEYELYGGGGRSSTATFDQSQHRFALGLQVRHETPLPVGADRAAGGEGELRGRVEVAGVGLEGATVQLLGPLPAREVKAGPHGAFDFGDVPAGRHALKATADGYKPTLQDVEVTAGGELATVTLLRPSGPGTVAGVVRAEKQGPVEGAEVTLEGLAPVRTAADGTFRLERAGPGPVKVAVKAKGFAAAEEVVQVPPEAQATITFTLKPLGERATATVRGLVRSATGKPVKATVRISDVNLVVPVKGDGRFVVQVPAGKYTLTIEATGYVTQVKTLEVADGDQAIFHADLQPVGR